MTFTRLYKEKTKLIPQVFSIITIILIQLKTKVLKNKCDCKHIVGE